ncbi:MAG: VCBS repeat-containing protein [Planctomycetota bacterium]
MSPLSRALAVSLGAAASLTAQFVGANHPTNVGPPRAIASADMDLDGDNDLVVAADNATVVLLNNGSGTAFTIVPIPVAGPNPVDLWVGQLDGSNRPEVVVIHASGATIGRSTSAIAFTYSNQLLSATGAPTSGAVVDLDGDDLLDLAIATTGPNTVRCHLGTGAGTFVAAPAAVAPQTAPPMGMNAGQFNADAREDLVTVGPLGSAVSTVFVNTSPSPGTISFAAPQQFTIDFRPFDVCCDDFNGDGFEDHVTANAGFGTISVMLNDPTAIAGTTVNFNRTDYPIGTSADLCFSIGCGDWDCDGDVDVALACRGTNRVAVLYNNGAGVFGAPSYFATDTTPYHIVVAELENDDDLDLATPNFTANDATVLRWIPLRDKCCHTMIGGIVDQFIDPAPPGPEDACPSPQLAAYIGTSPRREFDGPVTCGQVFGHSFSLPGQICEARLVVRMRADCTSSPDDAIAIGLNTAGGPAFAYVEPIADATGIAWNPGAIGTAVYDLSSMPGGLDLLPKMNADGRIDIYLRDDTAVDYIQLDFAHCSRPTDCSLGIRQTPIVTGSTLLTQVGGATPGGVVWFTFGTIGPGPVLPGPLQMCIVPFVIAPPVFATSSIVSLSFLFTPVLPPCSTISTQAVHFNGTGFQLSTVLTQQVFD